MKATFIILCLWLFTTSCKKESDKFFDESRAYPTSITLHLRDYNPKLSKGFVGITVENVLRPISEQLMISEDGKVTFTFQSNRTREVRIEHDGKRFNLIVSPNEKVEVWVKDWQPAKPLSNFGITGSNSLTNALILKYSHVIDSINIFAGYQSKEEMAIPLEAYTDRRLSRLKTDIANFEHLIAGDKSTKLFRNWAYANINYSAASDVSGHPWYGSNRNLAASDQHFKNVSGIRLHDEDSLLYLSYLNYVEKVSIGYMIMCNVSAAYKSNRSKHIKAYKQNLPVLYNVLQDVKSPDKQLLLAYSFKVIKDIPEVYKENLRGDMSPGLYRQLFEQQDHQNATIQTLLANYPIDINEKNALLKVYDELHGRVVYHVFWSAGCGPCMRELPYYNDLMADVGNAEFVFYGINMTEAEWQNTSARLKLNGRHYLLTKNQLAFFEKYGGLQGVPHHLMTDAAGRIIPEKFPALHHKNKKHIKDLIIQYAGS